MRFKGQGKFRVARVAARNQVIRLDRVLLPMKVAETNRRFLSHRGRNPSKASHFLDRRKKPAASRVWLQVPRESVTPFPKSEGRVKSKEISSSTLTRKQNKHTREIICYVWLCIRTSPEEIHSGGSRQIQGVWCWYFSI